MKNLKIIIIALLLIAINSCKKEDEVNPIDNPEPREFTPEIIQEEYGRARVVGFVKNKTGEPLDGVRVYFGEHESITNGEGKFQLSEVSEGSNKRIWFEKDGFARTQKLINVRKDLPNRVDASLFPIAATAKMTDEGGKIEGDDFLVEIQSGGFVYSDGELVTGEVTVSATPFLTSEEEFFDAFPGNFEGRREDGSTTPIESFGFIDVDLRDENGEPVQLAEGVTATIKIKAPENAPTTIPMWYYDFAKAEWIEEGIGNLENGFYTAEVNHFTPWNWDLPIELQPTIIGRVVDNEGNPIENVNITQSGKNRAYRNSTETIINGSFEMFTHENMELELEAQFDIYGSTVIEIVITDNENDVGDITINSSSVNVQSPIITSEEVFVTYNTHSVIKGNFFGSEKKNDYKLLINGIDVETSYWSNDEIKFYFEESFPDEGFLQIERGGFRTKKTDYIEGDWTCEIFNLTFDNNDLPEKGLRFLGDELTYLPFCIANLNNLEFINLSSNELTYLPKSIGNLVNVEIIYMKRNLLQSLPESFGNLKSLKELDFKENNLQSLPESFGNLSNLYAFQIFENQLQSLPESFGNLNNLRDLGLGYNQINSLPVTIGNLTKLFRIQLQFNNLSSLPESIGNLKSNLEILDLRGNNFSEEEKIKIESWLPNTDIKW